MRDTTQPIVEFLNARLDEDEKSGFVGRDERDMRHLVQDMDGPSPDEEYLAVYIGGGRVLADIAAKRAIVAGYVRADSRAEFPNYEGGYAAGLEDAVRELASVYSAHPDYRDEWKP